MIYFFKFMLILARLLYLLCTMFTCTCRCMVRFELVSKLSLQFSFFSPVSLLIEQGRRRTLSRALRAVHDWGPCSSGTSMLQYRYGQGYPHRLTHNRPSNVNFQNCATGFSLAALQICAFLAQVSPGGIHDLQGVSLV